MIDTDPLPGIPICERCGVATRGKCHCDLEQEYQEKLEARLAKERAYNRRLALAVVLGILLILYGIVPLLFGD